MGTSQFSLIQPMLTRFWTSFKHFLILLTENVYDDFATISSGNVELYDIVSSGWKP